MALNTTRGGRKANYIDWDPETSRSTWIESGILPSTPFNDPSYVTQAPPKEGPSWLDQTFSTIGEAFSTGPNSLKAKFNSAVDDTISTLFPVASSAPVSIFDPETPDEVLRKAGDSPFDLGKGSGKYQTAMETVEDRKSTWGSDLGRVKGEDILSAEDMAGYSSRQLAALHVNSELYNAIAADKADQDAGTELEYADYQTHLEELYGAGGTSEKYYPRTVALLRELGLGDDVLRGQGDLDHFVSNSALLTRNDLDNLGSAKTNSSLEGRALNAAIFADRAESRMNEVLAKGQSLLDSIRLNNDAGADLFGPTNYAGAAYALDGREDILARAFEFAMLDGAEGYNRDDSRFMNTIAQLSTAEDGPQIAPQDISEYFNRRLQQIDYSGGVFEPDYLPSDNPYMTTQEFRNRYLRGAS